MRYRVENLKRNSMFSRRRPCIILYLFRTKETASSIPGSMRLSTWQEVIKEESTRCEVEAKSNKKEKKERKKDCFT